MLEDFVMEVRRTKGLSSEREAFVIRTAQASEAASIYICLLTHLL